MGVCYLAALVLLWAGRRGKISRKAAAVVSAVCLLAGSGALAAAVYPIGNGYGKTVNRLTDLSGNGAVVVPSPGSAKTTAPLPDGAAQKSVPESGIAAPAAAASGELPGPKDNRENVSVISSGTVHDKWIALTFDDGPSEETDRMMASTDPRYVFLCYDTGHFTFAGEDPLSMLKKYVDRVGHVHLKDMRLPVVEEVKKNGWSFLKAVREGAFTVPGDGDVDFDPVFKLLSEAGYEGWLLVEAEQDPAKANPLEYAIKGRRYIAEHTGL